MRPEDLKYFHGLTDDRKGGLTVFLEAGGEPELGRIAVAWVIKNRVEHPSFQGHDIETVCFHEAAFSCFLSLGNPEYPKAVAIAQAWDIHADPTAHIVSVDYTWTGMDALTLTQCLEIFEGVISGRVPTPFKTADVFMYYAAGTAKPSWADKLAQADPYRIGKHLFYRGR
jgi:hypothetical protein